jgi:tetratricopeptide (TPR) repeat protein
MALLAGAGACCLVDAGRRGLLRRRLAWTASAAVVIWIVILAALTVAQTGIWRDSWTLWSHAVKVEPRCAVCLVNLGGELMERGRYEAAAELFEQALASRPDHQWIHGDVGLARAAVGRFSEAIDHYARAIAANPAAVNVRVNMATALARQGRAGEALEQLAAAVSTLGAAGAVAYFGQAVRLKPDAPVARAGLLEAYRSAGRLDLALGQHGILSRLDGALAREAEAHLRLN